jgi:hypothetical protein
VPGLRCPLFAEAHGTAQAKVDMHGHEKRVIEHIERPPDPYHDGRTAKEWFEGWSKELGLRGRVMQYLMGERDRERERAETAERELTELRELLEDIEIREVGGSVGTLPRVPIARLADPRSRLQSRRRKLIPARELDAWAERAAARTPSGAI